MNIDEINELITENQLMTAREFYYDSGGCGCDVDSTISFAEDYIDYTNITKSKLRTLTAKRNKLIRIEIYSYLDVNREIIFSSNYPASTASELLHNEYLDKYSVCDYKFIRNTCIKWSKKIGAYLNMENF
jgi:hypothetical protein